ncbi:hypothetical protein FDUTEX481_04096 [Tolypothrix sp. PCC 7601]|nr:hypothetical protein FDUTEX481_04096 [Tolypothrix sp. PCC 7601]
MKNVCILPSLHPLIDEFLQGKVSLLLSCNYCYLMLVANSHTSQHCS